MAPSLFPIRHLLIDLDGVLYRGNDALPDAAGFIAWLRQHGIAFRLVTNNSTLRPAQVAAKLGNLGIPAQPDDVFTSAEATALFLRDQGSGQSALVLGEEGLFSALEEVGIRLTDTRPDWVVVGLDRTVTYDDLRKAVVAIEGGARFVGSNPDTSLPTETGLAPGAGAILAAISATTGVQPLIVGKPQPTMLRLAMGQIRGAPESTAMLGDRLDTDIAAAVALGIPSILVLTGVSGREEAEHGPIRPTLIVEDLASLCALWDEALGAGARSR